MERLSDLKETSNIVFTKDGKTSTLKFVEVSLTHAEIHSIIHALAEKPRRNATDDVLLKDASVIDEFFEKEFKSVDEAYNEGN